jgi:hypothetical protein
VAWVEVGRDGTRVLGRETKVVREGFLERMGKLWTGS